MNLKRIVTCLSVVSVVVPAVCGTQLPPAQNPAQQDAASPAVTPISDSDMDAFAAKLVPEIKKHHFSTVAVFGALGPGDELTVLGPIIGDGFSVALARQDASLRVIDRSAIRERLKQERLSDSMLLTSALGVWISQMMSAQAMIFVSFLRSDPSDITVTAGLLDVAHRDEVPRFKISAQLGLDASQVKAATQHLYPFATLLDEIDRSQKGSDRAKGGQYSVEAKCVSCPLPNYSERARDLKIQGQVWLNVTITPKGEVTDISLVRAAGSGLDEESVMTVSRWRFNPARDKNGNPVSERIPLETTFQLY